MASQEQADGVPVPPEIPAAIEVPSSDTAEAGPSSAGPPVLPQPAAPISNTADEQPPAKKARKEDNSAVKDELTTDELKNLNVRQYLEKTVVPTLMQGMQQLVQDRPSDPWDSLADFLKQHNPKRKKPTSTTEIAS